MKPLVPVIDVHVQGDNTALYASLSAVLGVVIGAGFSWLQQRSKVANDERQLKDRLDAERERLELRLLSDRAATELDALRRVLDDGSVSLEETRRTVRELAEAAAEEDQDERERLDVKLQQELVTGQAIHSRVKLWLPDEDPIHAICLETIEEFNRILELYHDGEYQKVQDADNDLALKIESYQDEARKRVGLLSLELGLAGAPSTA